jgi:hypothetical protein
MSTQPFDIQLLWDRTQYGLEYFHEIYPDSIGKENKSKHFFCDDLHREKTPSFTLTNKGKSSNNVFRIHNHATKESFNAIDHVMKTNNVEFFEAVKFLFEKYGLAGAGKSELLNAKKEFKQSTEEPGTYHFTPKKLENQKVFAPFLVPEDVEEYGFTELESYSKVFINKNTNEPTCMTVQATEHYPIFGYVNDDFIKIYEPKAIKSATANYKHHFLGTKPERHIYGWKRLFDLYEDGIKDLKEKIKAAEEKEDDFLVKVLWGEIEEYKIGSVFIVSGGSDAFNLISLGHKNVIWFNSEAEKITFDEYQQLSKIANYIYYVPDNDDTGIAAAVSVGMQFLDMKICWLPKFVNEYTEEFPIKDIRDFVTKQKGKGLEHVRNLFNRVVGQALEFQFWSYNKKRGVYVLDEICMKHFLKHSGYYVYSKVTTNVNDPLAKKERFLVHVKNKVATMVLDSEIRTYVQTWAQKQGLNRKIINLIIKTPFFNENNLTKLDAIDINFCNWRFDAQYFMFRNKYVEVSKNEGIKDYLPSASKNVFWKNKIIDHHFTVCEPFFKIEKVDGVYDIEILNKNSNLLKVFINTSRMYWFKDADADEKDTNPFGLTSKKLTESENLEQKHHLINKIYVLGYLMHRYNDASNAYNVLGTDRTIGDSVKQSNGGSGKSFLLECLRIFHKNTITVDGNDLSTVESLKFAFDNVDSNTDMILMDDLNMYFPYRSLYSKTTGDFVANHKGKTVRISNEFKPKIAATTNYVPFDMDDAALRRQLNYQTSSYYHGKMSGYKFPRRIFDDFGMTLLNDKYPKDLFNCDYNFLLQCLHFYLNCDAKIDPPGDSMEIRNIRQVIGDAMLEFLDEFFADEMNYVEAVEQSQFYLEYENKVGKKMAKTKQNFNKHLKLYCEFEHKDKKTNNKYFINIQIRKKRVDNRSVPHLWFEKVDKANHVKEVTESEDDTPEPPKVNYTAEQIDKDTSGIPF